jgi:hypothetical protein
MDEGTVRFLRNSERKAYLTCRQMWRWSYVDRLSTRDVRPALDFGGLVHEALAVYYPPGTARGPAPWLTFEEKLRVFEEEHGELKMKADDDRVTAMELGTEMLRNYVAHYGDDSHMKVITPEMPFQVPAVKVDGTPLYVAGADGVWRRVVHVGTADLVYFDRSRRQIGVLETKTAAAIDTSHLGKDDQASSYWSLVPLFLQSRGILKPGQDIAFIEYNFLRKALADKRPQNAEGHYLNKNGTVSKSQPAPLFHRERVWRGDRDRLAFLLRIGNIVQEMSLVEKGRLPTYKNPSSSYPDQHCKGCEFRDMCELHEIGSDWQAYRQQMMGRWDPYETHREEAEER